MSLIDGLFLAVIMAGLAALPSSSVALVVVQSATVGMRSGFAAAAGIVLGDLMFVAMAIAGLTALSEALGAFFFLVRYLAAGYLIWIGITLLRSSDPTRQPPRATGRSPAGSFLAGLAITLGDIKAIVFYASLFPLFVDLTALSMVDVVTLVAITVVAVGGVKVAYAVASSRISTASQVGRGGHHIRRAAGGCLIGVGSYLAVKH
ncbi:MAG: LysE family translocator [Pseudomonadales bacterium]